MVRALHHTAERRAREAIARAGQAAPAGEPGAPAFTDRERRLRDLLLDELARLNQPLQLSYAEKKHLGETLDPHFIRKTLDELERGERWVRRLIWIAGVTVSLLFLAVLVLPDVSVRVESSVLSLLGLTGWFFYLWIERERIRRRRTIYAALAVLAGVKEREGTTGPGHHV